MDHKQIGEPLILSGLLGVLTEHSFEYGNGQFTLKDYPQLVRFAEMIAEDEREACAKLAEGRFFVVSTDSIAREIRARGEK